MRIDIVGSIIITLVLMIVVSILHLDFFASILLMIGAFVILNNWGLIKYWFRSIWDKMYNGLGKVPKKPETKSSFDRMDLNE